jgi:hypothetical protein
VHHKICDTRCFKDTTMQLLADRSIVVGHVTFLPVESPEPRRLRGTSWAAKLLLLLNQARAWLNAVLSSAISRSGRSHPG